MKIILFSNSCWNLYNFRKDLIIDLLSKNYQVIIVAPEDENLLDLTNLGCKYFNINLSQYGTNFFKELYTLFNLFFLFKKIKPSYIFSYTIKPNLYSSIICKLLKIKIICNISGLGNSFLKKNLVYHVTIFLYKFFLSKSYVIFFQNNDDLQLFKDLKILSKLNYYLLPGSGINLDFFKSNVKYKIDRPINFLFIGRFIQAKGINEFVNAANLIINDNKNITFYALSPTSENFIYYEKKYPYIKFLKTVKDVRNVLINTGCVVLPSYREGIPRSLIEACSMSIPVIASNVPGCKDVVVEGYNGFVCSVMSAVSLKDSMIKFNNLSFEDKYKMSKNSRNFAESKFNVNIVINKYNEFII